MLGILWLAAIASGFLIIGNYESTPGVFGQPPARWPKDSAVARALDKPTLVMLAHPRCPCTQASLEELSRIMARAPGRLQAQVLFYQPPEVPDSWSETALWRKALALPGVAVWRDKDSLEARRFSARTSGQVVLYDADGRLLFSGGITGLRGHIGDNAGRRAIATLLEQGKADTIRTPILGCSLEEPSLAGGKNRGSPLQRN